MTNEELLKLAAQVNKVLEALLPERVYCVALLHCDAHLVTVGNVRAQVARHIIAMGHEAIETQLAGTGPMPANDGISPPPENASRCRFCRRTTTKEHGVCTSCQKMTSPSKPE